MLQKVIIKVNLATSVDEKNTAFINYAFSLYTYTVCYLALRFIYSMFLDLTSIFIESKGILNQREYFLRTLEKQDVASIKKWIAGNEENFFGFKVNLTTTYRTAILRFFFDLN